MGTASTTWKEKLVANYIVVILVLVGVGLILAFLANRAPLSTELVSVPTSTQEVETLTMLRRSTAAVVCSIASVFLFTLAISVFIAVFVTTKLEAAIHEENEEELKRLRESIHADIFDGLFKKLVPKEIFSVLKADVISNRVLRKNAHWMYDFKEVGGELDLDLIQTIKYELHNTSHRPLKDAINSKCEVLYEGGLQRIVCMLDGKEVLSHEFSPEDFRVGPEEKYSEVCDGSIRISYLGEGVYGISADVEIPPGRHIDVTQVYKHSYRGECINDGYFTQYPLINATLIATYPPGYNFTIFESLSTPMHETLSEAGRSIFELEGGVLPHQGIVYTLKKERRIRGTHEISG